MKTLTEQFKKILGDCKVESPFPEGSHLLVDLLQAVKKRDEYVIGGDHFIHEGSEYKGNKKAVNIVKASQRQRAAKSL